MAKSDLIGNWVNKEEARKWPEGIVVVARRTELKPTNYGGVDLTTYFRPDQLDQLYSDTTLFMRLTPPQEGEVATKRVKR